MRIFTVIAVLGALVASAAAAGAAAASEPTFYECAKLAKLESGEFTNKNCSASGAGRFELREGIGRRHKFTMKSSFVELATEGFEPFDMTCAKTALGGENTSPTTVGGVFVKMSGCEESGALCSSPGQKAGVVLLGPLSGSLGYVNEEHEEVGTDLAGEGGRPLGEFECTRSGKPEFRLNGSIIGLRKEDINVVSKLFTLAFGTVSHLEGEAPDVPTLLDLESGEEEPLAFVAGFRGSGERLSVKA